MDQDKSEISHPKMTSSREFQHLNDSRTKSTTLDRQICYNVLNSNQLCIHFAYTLQRKKLFHINVKFRIVRGEAKGFLVGQDGEKWVTWGKIRHPLFSKNKGKILDIVIPTARKFNVSISCSIKKKKKNKKNIIYTFFL